MRAALVRSELGYICRYAFYVLPKFLHHRTSIRLSGSSSQAGKPCSAMAVSENPR